MVLGSSERIHGWRPGGVWTNYLTVEPKVFEVGRTHVDVLNMESKAFETHLKKCLEIARDNVREATCVIE